MTDTRPILIMGAGTVGNRIADILLSLEIPIVLCKYDAKRDKNNPDEYEIKVRELLELFKRYPNASFPMYAARGSNIKERIDNMNQAGLNCLGSIDDFDFSSVSMIIDASNGVEWRNMQELYIPKEMPFVLNGGADSTLVKKRFFAGVPGTSCTENVQAFIDNNCMVVSCNTHCVTTAISKLSEVLGKRAFPEMVRDIDITFCRRHEDPHKGVPKPKFTSVQVKPYHLDEMEALLPETEGMISTTLSKWPTEYFHTVIIDFTFYGPISEGRVEEYNKALEAYKRCIVVKEEVSQHKTMDAARWSNIPDGDLPFPVYMVKRIGDYKIKLLALTPQRGIVAPSCVDLVLLKTGRAKTFDEAFDMVNKNGRYRGHTFLHIKNSVRSNLEPDKYKVLKEKFDSN